LSLSRFSLGRALFNATQVGFAFSKGDEDYEFLWRDGFDNEFNAMFQIVIV
jgi:hypothetical protein